MHDQETAFAILASVSQAINLSRLPEPLRFDVLRSILQWTDVSDKVPVSEDTHDVCSQDARLPFAQAATTCEFPFGRSRCVPLRGTTWQHETWRLSPCMSVPCATPAPLPCRCESHK